jgi:APA family basic amino acid/polyamine antiporter
MSKKLKFPAIVSLVIGSQIGTGAFLLPASLAMLGPISLFGWFLSGTGAILLALVFAQLSMLVSKGGGPHAFVEYAFGRKAAFFTAWTYWLVSWVSSIAVIIAAVGYLIPLLGLTGPLWIFGLEAAVIIAITLLNLRGVAIVGSFEFYLTIFKCSPLVIIPLTALIYFKPEHFQNLNPGNLGMFHCLNTASLMTFWGFIGLEIATTASNIIDNPKKTIPRAVVLGTSIVAIIYLISSFGIMGIIPHDALALSSAPYSDAAQILFKNGFHLFIAVIAVLACLGTLNAWVLTSGQIAVEAAKDGLFHPLFGAPYNSLLISTYCIIPLLGLTVKRNILEQLNCIIDVSVITFLFVYMVCCVAFIKIIMREGLKNRGLYLMIATLAIGFCLWIVAFISFKNLLLCSIFIVSGVPIYLWQRRTKRKAECQAIQ